MVLLSVVLLVGLVALIAYAQVLMTPAMQNQMNQAIAGLISDADEVEQIVIPSYQIAEITESGEWGSVNSIVSDAKSDLMLYFLTVQQQLEANYPGGFIAWKNTGNPLNSTYYQAVTDAYNAYGQLMPTFNGNTEDMITNRQVLMLCSSGTLLIMAGTAVFASTPPVNVPVDAIGMGLIFTGSGVSCAAGYLPYVSKANAREGNYIALRNDLIAAAFHSSTLKDILISQGYWTSAMNTTHANFIDKNILAFNALEATRANGLTCEQEVFYVYDLTEYWFYMEIWQEDNN